MNDDPFPGAEPDPRADWPTDRPALGAYTGREDLDGGLILHDPARWAGLAQYADRAQRRIVGRYIAPAIAGLVGELTNDDPNIDDAATDLTDIADRLKELHQ